MAHGPTALDCTALADAVHQSLNGFDWEVHHECKDNDLPRAKSLIFFVGEEDRPVCVVCSGTDRINTKRVARHEKEKKIRLCSPEVCCCPLILAVCACTCLSRC
jgi:hypothetical protein